MWEGLTCNMGTFFLCPWLLVCQFSVSEKKFSCGCSGINLKVSITIYYKIRILKEWCHFINREIFFLKISTLTAKDTRKNFPVYQVGWSAPSPSTPSVIKVVLHHTERICRRLYSPTVLCIFYIYVRKLLFICHDTWQQMSQ